MFAHPRLRPIVFWVAVFALLLKAAVPALAALSAQVQGKPMAEICSVYGVVKVPLEVGDGTAPAEPAHGSQASEPCALTGLLTALAALPATPAPLARLALLAQRTEPAPPGLRFDATAQWAARHKHGPPALS